MRRPVFSKFVVLVIRDVATFAWPIVLFGSQMQRIPVGIAMILAVVAGRSTQRAKQMPESLSRHQMHVRVVIAVGGFTLWIGGIIWGAIILRSPPVWALSSVFIPVLCVFAYTSIRVKLALEPNIDPTGVGV